MSAPPARGGTRGPDLLEWIGSWFFVAVALVFLGTAAWTAVDVLRFQLRSVPAIGIVTEMRGDGGGRTAPVFDFVTRDGRAVRAGSEVFLNPSPWSVGDEVPLRYDPDRPDIAVPTDFMETWFLPAFLGAMGAAFSLGGGFALYFAFRDRRR